MKKMYLNIEAGAVVDSSTRFYHVKVGNTRHEQRALDWMQNYATQNGHYFDIRRADSLEFFSRVYRSVPNHLPVITIDICKLKKCFLNGTRPAISENYIKNNKKLLFNIDLNFRVATSCLAGNV